MGQDKETFLGRWSRLKREEEKAPAKAEAPKKDPAEAPPLPPVDQLDAKSDFGAFMHPKVQDSLRRVALRKLFTSDPHFNVPDPFEPFSGDWTGGEALSPELLKQLNQARLHLLSDEERAQHDRDELERDHAAALADDAERDAAMKTMEPKLDDAGRQDT